MNEAERAFYEWFHANNLSGVLLDTYRSSFLAGWFACQVGSTQSSGDKS